MSKLLIFIDVVENLIKISIKELKEMIKEAVSAVLPKKGKHKIKKFKGDKEKLKPKK